MFAGSPCGIPLWHRMTVIRLTNGGLVVHSPTRLDLTSQEEFQKLGPIVAIIAPSWWHDLYLREDLGAYPDDPAPGWNVSDFADSAGVRRRDR